MPASRATASIETAWKPRSATICLVTSSSCSRRSAAVIRAWVSARGGISAIECYDSVTYGYVTYTSVTRPPEVPSMSREFDVIILGSGFSRLGMAVRLKQAGVDDFAVLERGDDVGGTWHYNNYPGCACDVPSHLYSFSFAQNPDWSQTYSPQPEIRDYLRSCAERFGIGPHMRLRHTVQSASWNEDEQRWELETSEGPFRARVLVGGFGPLTEPQFPDIPGLDRFQ